MAPKQQFCHDDIVTASFNLVRKHGWEGLTARAIAKELNSSTRPIYDHLKSMKKIETEVVKKALAYFVEFISQERTGDKWLDQALGYVLFASTEKHLFRCINDEKHIQMQKQNAKEHWIALGEQLSNDKRFDGLPEKTKSRIRLARWIFIHGLSFLVNSGWYDLSESEDSIISADLAIDLTSLLKRANRGLYEEFNY